MAAPFGGITLQGADDVAIQSDGKIVVVGYALGTFNVYDFLIARYNSDGSLDSSFGSGGGVLTDFARGSDFATQIIIQPDGKLLVGGYAVVSSRVNYDFGLARLNTDGSLDSTFGSRHVHFRVPTDSRMSSTMARALRLSCLLALRNPTVVSLGQNREPLIATREQAAHWQKHVKSRYRQFKRKSG